MAVGSGVGDGISVAVGAGVGTSVGVVAKTSVAFGVEVGTGVGVPGSLTHPEATSSATITSANAMVNATPPCGNFRIVIMRTVAAVIGVLLASGFT